MENNTMNLKCEALKDCICNGINQAQLPPYVSKLILEVIISELQPIVQSAIQQERMMLNEKETETTNNPAEDTANEVKNNECWEGNSNE